MLTGVQVQAPGDDILDLTLEDYSQGYILTNIEGLEPVKANIVATDYAQLDGTRYLSSYRSNRDVKFTIELEPYDYTTSVSELRAHLYKFFLPKTPVTLIFEDDILSTVQIKGYVEDFSTELFSKTPTINVSVYCSDPDFVETTTSSVTGVSGGLSYPFTYKGDVETGMVMTIRSSQINSGLTIYHGVGAVKKTFQLDYQFAINDVITISSVRGDKYVTLNRNGVVSSILYSVVAGSVWPVAKLGTNTVQVQQTKSGSSFTATWLARRGGL